jgi:RHS repeat-associated protein
MQHTWYDWNQKVTTTGGLTVVSTVWAPSVGGYSRYGGGGSSYGPVGLKGVASSAPSTPLVGIELPTVTSRNNYTGWVGAVIQIGSSPVTISELGRWKLPGNFRTHTVKIVQENNVDLPGALVTVNMASGSDGTFVYSALPAPVTLEANKAYYLVTSVTDQGDTWYDWNQKVTTTGGLTVVSTVWAPSVGGYSRYGAGGSSYGPVGLKSGSGAQIGVTTTLASYEFDDENQLVSITRGTQSQTIFKYDGKRRRRVTQEKTKNSSGEWVLASETRYVYDGMRVIQERTSNGVPTVAYTRGPDLSGTLEGTGGIGGLLARSEWDGSAWSRHAFYHSDGVGNVTALAVPNGSEIVLAGSYRYDPFGRLIGTPSGLAAINTQRFSSKDWHNASGFYSFGYRFYDPDTQRWLNRDPMGERGGINVYGYVYNNPVNLIDPTGEFAILIPAAYYGYAAAIAGVAYLATSDGQQALRNFGRESAALLNSIGDKIFNENHGEEEEEELYKPKAREKCPNKMGGEDNDPNKGKGPKKGTAEYEKYRRELEDMKRHTGRGGRDNPPDGDDWY